MKFKPFVLSRNWQDQYYRMKRWFILLTESHNDRINDKISINNEDIIYGFFQNCYHLKDWIKNDLSTQSLNVEGFVENDPWLLICGDICNGTKHFNAKYDFSLRDSNSNTDISVIPTFREINKYHPIQEMHFDISIKGMLNKNKLIKEMSKVEISYDPVSVAYNCIKSWDNFIKENNLKIS